MLRPGSTWKRLCLVSLLAVSLATPWFLLQSVAWVGMVVSFSRDHSLAQAVSMTLDGKHPCKMCRFVQKEQAQERQQPVKSFNPGDAFQLGLPPLSALLVHPPVPRCAAGLELAPPTLAEPPPFPPPRPA